MLRHQNQGSRGPWAPRNFYRILGNFRGKKFPCFCGFSYNLENLTTYMNSLWSVRNYWYCTVVLEILFAKNSKNQPSSKILYLENFPIYGSSFYSPTFIYMELFVWFYRLKLIKWHYTMHAYWQLTSSCKLIARSPMELIVCTQNKFIMHVMGKWNCF